ncbi:hypothetical protein D5018_15005 [Parashewanella curva]|uniref:Uncharacterized protein n=1 Tax=Parashewanella curva TaxID=2338552 RepID=A0A3L8PVQ1_9GAMM|nr:hypothetical protein [Parashewanella curva]RLV58859.1 hypothetical protein D5018_15005 [Parashewanella curva]
MSLFLHEPSQSIREQIANNYWSQNETVIPNEATFGQFSYRWIPTSNNKWKVEVIGTTSRFFCCCQRKFPLAYRFGKIPFTIKSEIKSALKEECIYPVKDLYNEGDSASEYGDESLLGYTTNVQLFLSTATGRKASKVIDLAAKVPVAPKETNTLTLNGDLGFAISSYVCPFTNRELTPQNAIQVNLKGVTFEGNQIDWLTISRTGLRLVLLRADNFTGTNLEPLIVAIQNLEESDIRVASELYLKRDTLRTREFDIHSISPST